MSKTIHSTLSIVLQFISCLLQDTLIIEKGQYDKNCFSFVPGFIIMLCICESEGDSRYGIQDGGADRCWGDRKLFCAWHGREYGRGLPREARFSTLQDLDAKRPTEIEMFSGTLIRMGKELGVPTPFNEFAYHTIRALEEKNAGKFC